MATASQHEPKQSAKSNVEQVEEQDPTSFGAMVTTSGESTDLATLEEATPFQREYESDPEFDQSEVTMPRLRIAQGLTPEVQEGTARPGDVLLLGHEPVKTAVLIPVMFGRTRRRADPTDRMAPPLCQSPNGRKGIGDPGIDCNTCPYARWRQATEAGGKNTPPECSMTYSYVGYSPTFESVTEFSIRATTKGALDAAKKINMFIQAARLGNFAIEVSSAQSKNGRGASFHVPTVTKISVSPEELASARAMCAPAAMEVDEPVPAE